MVIKEKKDYICFWDAYGFAAAKGNIQITKILIDNGFQLNKRNKGLMDGCTQFHQKGILEWIKREHSYLLKAKIDEIIKYENFDVFDIYIQNCYNIDHPINRRGKTPLHYAMELNRKTMGELLISFGASINMKDIIDR